MQSSPAPDSQQSLEPSSVRSSKTWTAELGSEDPVGNPLEPLSPYSWIYRAWARLGRVKKTLQDSLGQRATHAPTIFAYGDAVLLEPDPGDLDQPLGDGSWETCKLLCAVYFERAMATYRFLHMPTVMDWLQQVAEGGRASHGAARLSICYMVLAHGSLYLTAAELESLRKGDGSPISTEALFRKANSLLGQERGPPTLESVQARLIQVHHLISSSRPNEAWYAFGTTVQLTFAMGIHRSYRHSQGIAEISLESELRRRTFWSVYATDKYISIALGRPVLIQENLPSQDMPLEIDDRELPQIGRGVPPQDDANGDCTLSATIAHITLSRIVDKAIRSHYEQSSTALFDSIQQNQTALDEWKTQLSPLFSGTIHPHSLIPVFRRQAVVLNTFYLHAVVLINRPSLLFHFDSGPTTRHAALGASVRACMDASTKLAEQVIRFSNESQKIEIYWFTQNITFNAISILYLYILRTLQLEHGLTKEAADLLCLAQNAQDRLMEAIRGNAPSLRYSLVLDELRAEVQQRVARIDLSNAVTPNTSLDIASLYGVTEDPLLGLDNGLFTTMDDVPGSFWPWFDSIPQSEDNSLLSLTQVERRTGAR
ncbi:hypothetical protein GQ53DRAFT_823101 [Thozetella sp. PMI_491]|nr:hypothetical protein GQ53DRAFT_823101 [Thozetella sp. PMI_491]